jgi:hypothetical protein
MTLALSTFQKNFAQHQTTFGTNLLSADLAESLRRASLACAENQKGETGIVDLICGLYLQDPNEITLHFSGDFETIVSRTFPIHRFGREGLVPKVMLDQATSDDDSCSGFGFSLRYTDELHNLLWLSARLANAVGKNASFKDVVAAVTLKRAWTKELADSGITPRRILADFDGDVATVIFYATPHMGEGWPREMDFEHDGSLHSPYALELNTPAGPFQPVRSARVNLNGSEVAAVTWPEKPSVKIGVELRNSNKIEFELDGPPFGSIEVIVRGTATDE